MRHAKHNRRRCMAATEGGIGTSRPRDALGGDGSRDGEAQGSPSSSDANAAFVEGRVEPMAGACFVAWAEMGDV